MTTKEEEAPPQETLEQQPLSNQQPKKFGTFPSPRSMDDKMPKRMQDICNEWIVSTHQFDEMENASGALICARFLRTFLIFFIVTSTLGLIVGFVFKASLAAPMETEQYSSLAAPSVVFCPSPWGSSFLGFSLEDVEEGVIPGPPFQALPTSNYTLEDFNSSLGMSSAGFLTGCKYVKLNDVMLKPLGFVAQYSAFETIRVTVNAQTEDGKFNFGFCNSDNEMPQRWQYGSLGSRITGEIKYDQVNVGATEVSEGVPRSILGFKSSGSANIGSKTELEYYYGYFMVRILSAQAKGLTIFSCVAFVLLVAAAVNNCGLFELFFVEVVPDDEPPPSLEPNLFCQHTLGRCFASCRRRKGDPAEEGEADEAPADAEAKA